MLATMLGPRPTGGRKARLSPHGPCRLARALDRIPRDRSGADADRHHHGRHLWRHLHPTEAAAVSAVYAFVIAVWVYGTSGCATCPGASVLGGDVGDAFYIITNAVMFAFILTSEQIPQALSDWIVSLVLARSASCCGERDAAVHRHGDGAVGHRADHGADPVSGRGQAGRRSGAFRDHDGREHGEIGLCTPPVGLNLYVGRPPAISKLGLTEVTKAALPWLATALVFLMLVTYIPTSPCSAASAWDALGERNRNETGRVIPGPFHWTSDAPAPAAVASTAARPRSKEHRCQHPGDGAVDEILELPPDLIIELTKLSPTMRPRTSPSTMGRWEESLSSISQPMTPSASDPGQRPSC